MTKSDWQSKWYGSPESVDARTKLRAVAKSAAEQTGHNSHDVLRALVTAQLSVRYADSPGAIPSAVEFQIGLHDSDELRKLTRQALTILEADEVE